jgi:hypothetical protein
LAVCILYAFWAWCCCRGWVYWYLCILVNTLYLKKQYLFTGPQPIVPFRVLCPISPSILYRLAIIWLNIVCDISHMGFYFSEPCAMF